jgi:hypothetical protein
MRKEDYAKDFKEEKALEKLDQLSDSAPGRKFKELNRMSAPTAGKDREKLYAALAGHYETECDLLIAFTNGIWNGRIGGTSHIVEEVCSVRSRHNFKRRLRHVFSLSVARKSNPFPSREKFTWHHDDLSFSPSFRRKWVSRWKRVAPHWHKFLLLFLGMASLAASGLGYVLDGWSPWDAIPYAAGHLTLNGFDSFSSTNALSLILVRAGRWLGLLFVLLGAVIVLMELFSVISLGAKLRWTRFHRHDIICGLGRKGRLLLEDPDCSTLRSIGIERAPDPSAKAICARRDIPLVEGNAARRETLERAGLSKLARAFICTGSDDTNMLIVHRIADLSRSFRGQTTFQCSVELEEIPKFGVLRNALPSDHRLDLHIFNTEEITARMVLRENHLDRFTASPSCQGARVILIGDSKMADALLRQILLQSLFEDGKTVTILCPTQEPHSCANRFVKQFPCFTLNDSGQDYLAVPSKTWSKERVLPEIRFTSLPPSVVGQEDFMERELSSPSWVTTVIVAEEDAATNLNTATAIAPTLERLRREKAPFQDIALWVYTNFYDRTFCESIEHKINKDAPDLPILSIEPLMGRCTRCLLAGEEEDRVAQNINGFYAANGSTPPDPQLIREAWMHASEPDKDSSRQAAAHAWVKYRIRSRLRQSGLPEDHISEAIARIEHRRWCAEYLLNHFRPLTRIPSEHANFIPSQEEQEQIKNWFSGSDARTFKQRWKSRKRHISLIPFDDFDRLFDPAIAAKEKTKDSDQIKNLDRFLGPKPYDSDHAL